jgi:hypothetical protein
LSLSTQELFQRLKPATPLVGSYLVRCSTDLESLRQDYNAELRTTMRRMQVCFEILDAGAGWDYAISEALRQVPVDAN